MFRSLTQRFAVAVTGIAFFWACSPLAHAANTVCPAGTQYTIVRISTINPDGSRAGFNLAAEHHMAWYRAHGFNDNQQIVTDVLTPDPVSHTMKIDPAKVMTIHYNVPDSADAYAKDRAGWDAYVAEYVQNSTIASETIACFPLAAVP